MARPDPMGRRVPEFRPWAEGREQSHPATPDPVMSVSVSTGPATGVPEVTRRLVSRIRPKKRAPVRDGVNGTSQLR